MNILGYAKKYKDKTFFEEPFNVVDALIFAELAYVNFYESLKEEEFVLFKDLEVESNKKFYGDSYDGLNNKKLLDRIKDTIRYGEVKVAYCHRLDDFDADTQFFGVTFILPTGEGYISYRGTDTSIHGIKEDLLIAYQDAIPGAVLASDYLAKATTLFDGKFYIGGHSKGGNLAVYAAFKMDKSLNNRLTSVYSFDGPGAKKEIKDYENWEQVLPKVNKYVTNNDIVGVVYNQIKDAKIVYSTGIMLGGHDLFKWQVDSDKPDFIYTKNRSVVSKSHEEALMNWLTTMSTDDKQLAVDILVEFLGESKTPYDLILKSAKNLSSGKRNWDSYSIEQKNKAKEIFKQLGKYYFIAYSPKSLLAKKRENDSDKEDQ